MTDQINNLAALLESTQMAGTQVMNHDYAAAGTDNNAGTYVGPTESHNRFIAGDIVTHCQFIHDRSLWTVQPMHPERLNRLRRMLDATRPRYDCDTCQIGCNTFTLDGVGWRDGKPCISTEESRNQ